MYLSIEVNSIVLLLAKPPLIVKLTDFSAIKTVLTILFSVG